MHLSDRAELASVTTITAYKIPTSDLAQPGRLAHEKPSLVIRLPAQAPTARSAPQPRQTSTGGETATQS